MQHLKSLNKYFWKYRLHFFGGIVFVILSNLFAVAQPTVIRRAFDLVAANLKSAQFGSDFGSQILIFALIVLGLAMLRGFFLFLMRQTIIVMSRRVEYDQKNELYSYYQKLEPAFYKSTSTGELMARLSEDVGRVRMYVGPGIMYTTNLVIIFILIAFNMFRVSPSLACCALAPLPLLGIIIYFVNSVIQKKGEQIQQQVAHLTSYAQESYSGIRIIKSFGREHHMRQFFGNENDLYRARSLSLAKIEAVFFPAIIFLVGISTILTIYIGGQQVIAGTITAGTIAEFVIYINMLTWPIASVGSVTALIQRAAASQKRINEMLQTTAVDFEKGIAIHSFQKIEFKNVALTYPNTGITALQNLNFSISRGEKIAIIGRTGTGKTSITQLLTRLIEPSGGEIVVDGNPFALISAKSIRSLIGYAPQDVFLFSDSVKSNIAFGAPDAAEESIAAAAGMADVEKDILQLPEFYNTVIGERGVTLSGGQKQRISLARALIRQPQLLILDDVLSAVDAHTATRILRNLKESLNDSNLLVVTHRIFPEFYFDKILVLENGSVAESGTHESLLAQGKIYASLWREQQEKGEIHSAVNNSLAS